jgi:hypothetical protein
VSSIVAAINDELERTPTLLLKELTLRCSARDGDWNAETAGASAEIARSGRALENLILGGIYSMGH